MTIEEKAAILSGKTVWQTREIDRLSIPSIFLSDGPHGIRKQAGAGDHLGLNASLNATCFPTAATIANSWNQDLGEEIGQALGEEAASMDVNILLGPGLNIKRSPLCGRNFEYFSEDPYLSGKMAASYIRGIQSKGVYACPKHLAVNSQELRRMAMDAVVDERTLREIYLASFEGAVKKSKPWTVMSSYNRINGKFVGDSKEYLTDILREEWGFDGVIISDWGACADLPGSLWAGMDLEMPDSRGHHRKKLVRALNQGISALVLILSGIYVTSQGISELEIEVVRSTMEETVADQIVKLEDKIIVLMTAVSISPFLGLFGTVWGIMLAFSEMAMAGKPL